MLSEPKGLNEECGVFGIWGNPNAASITHLGLHTLQHRGQEGAGIVGLTKDGMRRHYGLGLLSEVFTNTDQLTPLMGRAALGHVRYSTAGGRVLENIQPLLFRFSGELESQGAIFQSTSDTEVLMHLIRRQVGQPWLVQLKKALNEVHGGFAFVLLTEHGLYAAVDPHGFRPMVVGIMPDGGYIVCSETAALDAVGADFVRDVQPGELITIDDDGLHLDHFTTNTSLAVCSMEYIYFARPDSDIHGINVHQARVRMGERLAREQPADADIVVGVPNSSLSAAIGYAKASGIPYEMGLVKSQYVARTFIQPTQALREKSVKMKLSVIKPVVAGKRIVLVDDSIVRGTTANHSVPEMRDLLDVESLGFLSTQGLEDSVGLPTTAPNGGLCVAYFTGKYPTALDDYAPALNKEVASLKVNVAEVSA